MCKKIRFYFLYSIDIFYDLLFLVCGLLGVGFIYTRHLKADSIPDSIVLLLMCACMAVNLKFNASHQHTSRQLKSRVKDDFRKSVKRGKPTRFFVLINVLYVVEIALIIYSMCIFYQIAQNLVGQVMFLA